MPKAAYKAQKANKEEQNEHNKKYGAVAEGIKQLKDFSVAKCKIAETSFFPLVDEAHYFVTENMPLCDYHSHQWFKNIKFFVLTKFYMKDCDCKNCKSRARAAGIMEDQDHRMVKENQLLYRLMNRIMGLHLVTDPQ